MKKNWLLLCILLGLSGSALAQRDSTKSQSGWISLGVRSTASSFDHDGFGIGTGGQFRVRFSNRINTDWYADYISINVDNLARSEYLHIGWSVLYYPTNFRKIQPYVLAGHCFDYNKKNAIQDPSITKSRGGAAVQAGLGTHFNLSERFDVSLLCQYMIHLTKELHVEMDGNTVVIEEHSGNSLEGHLLTTLSLNYKLFKAWKRK